MASHDLTKWDGLTYRRRIETFGNDDEPVVAAGPKGEFDGIWWVKGRWSIHLLSF